MTDPVNKPPRENGQAKEETLSQEVGRILREAYFPPLRERTMEERMLGFRGVAKFLAQRFGKCKH